MTEQKNKYAVVTDFDGTLTSHDVADLLVKHYNIDRVTYTPEHKCDDDAKYWMQCFLGSIKAGREDFEKTVISLARPREGMMELIQTCFEKDIPFEIVSGGLDIYINPFLREMQISGVPVYCANAQFTPGGIKVDYPLLEGYSLEGFKAMRVNHYQNLGYKVIFCGDGVTDYTAALNADAAFARDRLLARCMANNVPVNELDSFKEVIELIRK